MEGLSHVASTVGKPLYMDKSTATRLRVQYAKVCLEVDLGDKLPKEIMVDIESIGEITMCVEYPWRPVVCPSYPRFGHSEQDCGRMKG